MRINHFCQITSKQSRLHDCLLSAELPSQRCNILFRLSFSDRLFLQISSFLEPISSNLYSSFPSSSPLFASFFSFSLVFFVKGLSFPFDSGSVSSMSFQFAFTLICPFHLASTCKILLCGVRLCVRFIDFVVAFLGLFKLCFLELVFYLLSNVSLEGVLCVSNTSSI